ncbi:MAG: hypothetical protein PHQ01_03780 [Candidatus Pacebacteria bacterium]|nr:hypothetical protein [Candidatus Paceibacterota bacterium]
MDKKLIKKELIDYNRQFKQMMGTFDSFNIVYDYINFITSDLYLKEKLLPIANDLEKEAQSLEASNIDLDNFSIDLSSPEGVNQMPIFKDLYTALQENITSKKDINLTMLLPVYLTVLSQAAFMIQDIKDNQKLGKTEEVKKMIENIKIKSFSLVDTSMITGAESKKMTYGQYLDIAMEQINKFLIDEIDSESLLENEKPQANLSYNSDDCLLYINGKEIRIKLKTVKPVDAFVLDALFSDIDNLGEEMDLSEVASCFDIEASYNSSNDYQRYRHACDNLNKKIAKQTDDKITGFIVYTTGKTGWCKINKKYL